MWRVALTAILSTAAFTQTSAGLELAAAAQSPYSLTKYLRSHESIDWKSLRSALRLPESDFWVAPCGGEAPGNSVACSVETINVADPAQVILFIRGGTMNDEYLRYLKDQGQDWTFSGGYSASKRQGPSSHSLARLGNKPILIVESNHSQNGATIGQQREDWFDLTLPRFEPIFSFTSEGNSGGLGYTLGRQIKARSRVVQLAPAERIEVRLEVQFFDDVTTYAGVFERRTSEKTFSLREAYLETGHRTPIPITEYEDLANPFADTRKPAFLRHAFHGFEAIAGGSDADRKAWARGTLERFTDCDEKRRLLELLNQ